MHAPRRHYRRLLLPPGWVALGFLLLLGCQALLTHERQMRLPNVIQLAMPLSRKKVEERHREGTPYHQLFYNPLDSLDSETSWYGASFDGEKMNDFMTRAAVQNMMLAIKADTRHARGARIYLHQGATYDNLVSLLELMNRLKHRYYWFDIQHQPIAFYVVNNKAAQQEESAEISHGGCCMCSVEINELPMPSYSFLQLVQQTIYRLWQPAWRLTTLLFIAVSFLSFHRLAHLRRLTR